MNNQTCERCLEMRPLVATVKAETYTIRVCQDCADKAEKLRRRGPRRLWKLLAVAWDKKEKKNAH